MEKCSRVKCKKFAGWKDKTAKPCTECKEADKKISVDVMNPLNKFFFSKK